MDVIGAVIHMFWALAFFGLAGFFILDGIGVTIHNIRRSKSTLSVIGDVLAAAAFLAIALYGIGVRF